MPILNLDIHKKTSVQMEGKKASTHHTNENNTLHECEQYTQYTLYDMLRNNLEYMQYVSFHFQSIFCLLVNICVYSLCRYVLLLFFFFGAFLQFACGYLSRALRRINFVSAVGFGWCVRVCVCICFGVRHQTFHLQFVIAVSRLCRTDALRFSTFKLIQFH